MEDTMDHEAIDLLIRQALNIGEAMYLSGAEIHRIEETLHRLGVAYGAQHVNVYAITSSIVVTMEFPGEPAMTQSRRIKRSSMDLHKLEKINELCRRCEQEPLPVEELQKQTLAIISRKPDERRRLLGEILAASAFTVFFGGGAWDAFASALGACFIFLLEKYFRPLCSGQIFFNLAASFLSGAATCLAGRLFPALQTGKIIIGDIMILIPGIAITTSIQYSLSGDSISSVEKLIDSLLQGFGIATGFAIAMHLFG